MILKDECTIVYTWYNTPNDLWQPSIGSALKTNLPILIVDDQSTPNDLERLKRSVSGIERVNVVVPDKKLHQVGATHFGASYIDTKYMIRMDSDDIIISIPDIPNHFDWDVINGRIIQPMSLDNLLEGYQSNLNGSIVKTEIFKNLYSDWEMFNEYNYDFHEDLWYGFKLWLLYKDLTFIKSTKRHYKSVVCGVSKLVPRRSRLEYRIHTIKEVMKVYDIGSPDKYIDIIKSTFKSQPEILKQINLNL